MYHQFKELGDVDITKEPMEVAPTCHYVMGGVEVDADTQQASVPGLYAVGEVSGGMHGANRLGGNSLGDLLVFGKRAGEHAADYVASLPARPAVAPADVDAALAEALRPFSNAGEENPYTVQHDLQEIMFTLVGIIRTAEEMKQALKEIEALKERATRVGVEGGRAYNPGWHTALDLRSMLTVSESITRAALERTESRGGHTRDDYPLPDPTWGQINLIVSERGGKVTLDRKPLPEMPDDLKELFEETH
jgi:succinate dehydrogenase / fumarate reductase, flavoprotein subunit